MIFIDTGPLLARTLAQDQYHDKAVKLWEKIYKNQESCTTSNFVLDEFFTLLARKVNYSYAAERAKNIFHSQAFTILRPDLDVELEAVEIFSKYADQKISFTDCISFVLIRQHKIRRVFSFDNHFRIAGFQLFS